METQVCANNNLGADSLPSLQLEREHKCHICDFASFCSAGFVPCPQCAALTCKSCLVSWFKSCQSTKCTGCSFKFTARLVPFLDTSIFRVPFWNTRNRFEGRGAYTFEMMCCNDFLQQPNLQCAVCLKQYCRNCMTHTCSGCESNNFKLFSTLAKNCPRCLAYLERESGCFSAYCNNCSCSFNWNTGEFLDSAANHSRQISVFNDKFIGLFCKANFILVFLHMYTRIMFPLDWRTLDTFYQWSFQTDLRALFEKIFGDFISRALKAQKILDALEQQQDKTTDLMRARMCRRLFKVLTLTSRDQKVFFESFKEFQSQYRHLLLIYRIRVDREQFLKVVVYWEEDLSHDWATFKGIYNSLFQPLNHFRLQ